MRVIVLLCCLLVATTASAQKTVKALFLGNSYTYGNDLPSLLAQLADSDLCQFMQGYWLECEAQIAAEAKDASKTRSPNRRKKRADLLARKKHRLELKELYRHIRWLRRQFGAARRA